VWQRAGGHAEAALVELGREDPGHVLHPYVVAGADVAVTRGLGHFHGEPVRDGEVANVHDGEADPG
jgi:hypothetical protein